MRMIVFGMHRGIGNSAGGRVRHASSSRCPGKLCASLHGSYRIHRLRGESALCPSCGAPRGSPHRSPDSPPPLLNREDLCRRARQVKNECRVYQAAAGDGPQPPPKASRLLSISRCSKALNRTVNIGVPQKWGERWGISSRRFGFQSQRKET